MSISKISVAGIKSDFKSGASITLSGQQVDGVWHGPCLTVKDSSGCEYRSTKVNGKTHGIRHVIVREEPKGEQIEMLWMTQ